jgi:hypothetical protein
MEKMAPQMDKWKVLIGKMMMVPDFHLKKTDMVLTFLIPTWYDHVDNMLMPITWVFVLQVLWFWPPKHTYITGWWFGTCFIFPYIGNNHPNWLSYFSEGLVYHQPDQVEVHRKAQGTPLSHGFPSPRST